MSSYYVYRLIPPRPSFDHDMDENERATMLRHAEYWKELLASGRVLIYGPVRDATGAWGLGVIRADSDEEARMLAENDPAISSGMARTEIGPMVQAILGS